MFKKIIKKWNDIGLIFRILGGILLAVILYLIFKDGISWLHVFGDLFVGALKAIAPVLVFTLIASSLANAKGNIGKRFTLVIVLYMVTTLIASLVAVGASFIFPVTVTLTGVEGAEGYTLAQNVGEVLLNLLNNAVANPVSAIMNGNYMGILFWSITLGIAFKLVAKESSKVFMTDLSNAVATIVRGIISFAPFGILGLVYTALADTGFSIFTDYGKIIAIIVGCMLTTSLILNPLLAGLLLKKNPYPLVWRCIKGSAVTAFFTRSSAANIPVNMSLCKNLGLDPDFYSVSIPLGATINMDGAAVTIAVMALCAANTLGVSVDFGTALLLCIVATLGACGASGIAGGSLLLIPLACSFLGIGNDVAMQMVSIGFIIGVIQDSVETALNSSGDVLFTATAEFYEMRKQGKEFSFKLKTETEKEN